MLKDLSKTLSFFFVQHTLNEELKRIYFKMPNFTAYIEFTEEEILYLKVYRPFSEGEDKNTEKDKNVCRAQKYLILKRLWLLNGRVNNKFPIEPMPDSMPNTLLFPNEKPFRPIIITEFE